MHRAEYDRQMAAAVPHGPEEPCSCDGLTTSGEQCVCWPGHEVGCTCDIDWEAAYWLQREHVVD